MTDTTLQQIRFQVFEVLSSHIFSVSGYKDAIVWDAMTGKEITKLTGMMTEQTIANLRLVLLLLQLLL